MRYHFRPDSARISVTIDGVRYAPGEWKKCVKCDKAKPADQFTKLSRSEDGRKPYCRECAKKMRAKRKMTGVTLSTGARHWATHQGGSAERTAKEAGLLIAWNENDAQRKRVYSADYAIDDLLDRKSLTEDEITDLYARISADYGRKPPRVRYAEGHGASWANRFEIKLTGAYGKRLMVVIHEMAHYLDLSGVEGHGAPYVGVYIELLERYAGLDRATVEDVFRKNRVRFVR